MGKRLRPGEVKAALLGGTIVHVELQDDGELALVVTNNSGLSAYGCRVWRDEEGNGPGHLYVERIEGSR